MSNFFDSDIIQEELTEINQLQEEVHENIFLFGEMSDDQKIYYIELMERLLEKQQIMYTRLSLSDDPKAIEMKENLRLSLSIMGFPEDTDLGLVFNNMASTIKSLRKFIDK